MKAVLTAERPAGPEWVFERKLDGIRCLAVKDGGRTWLYSRTGFTRATLRELSERLAPPVRNTSPFEPEKGIPRAATWVEAELVAKIAFMEWTRDGRLRHPSFLDVRFDKPAREVIREEP